jgi:Fe-S-cluster containining protein
MAGDACPLDRYLELRGHVTRTSGQLFEHYAPHLRCGRGCYYCCDEITVLPIELEAVRLWLRDHGTPAASHQDGPSGSRRSEDRAAQGTFPTLETSQARCAFLGREGECTIYGGRPIICRTHGLPLAYRVYEYDRHGRELHPDRPEYTDLWCDLNFASLSGDRASGFFDEHGRINMDELNRAIEQLNEEFLDTDAGAPYRGLPPGEDRFPLKTLLRRSTPPAPRRSASP